MLRSLLIAFLFVSFSGFAQFQSPESFLGYPIGAHYTSHDRVVSYFQSAAEASKSTMVLKQYGSTNEGRPLLAAFISSAANISRLSEIQAANTALSQNSQQQPPANMPAIVWLSYNVHGNEASSTEAALLTLHKLLNPDANVQKWLANTVVVIDPCLNPDGRERYVNWFNSVVGKEPNPNINAREHNEPWPGGRVNHYMFDLNRDWAWQTQKESKERVALYQSWLPQIHVDFHEQEIDNPYYFAPAAQPYHEVITGFQREFQQIIGRNHARYFDQNGWLYFTKEVFDLTYPAYGDTYPIYNGAIGMTYEQAGHSMAGLAVITSSGDTLTLKDRALHHFTTSLSTIEVASQNNKTLMNEFKKFYDDALAGRIGEYKTYVIPYNANDEGRIKALKDLLKANRISYGQTTAKTAKGYSYETGKLASFNIGAKDLVISAAQSRGTLVKVLMEPSTKLVDTLAYDITAWALPYAYGVKAYATTEMLPVQTGAEQPFTSNAVSDNYGYVIRWDGMQSARLVAQLMKAGIRMRFNETAFEAGGEKFDRGAVLVLKGSNPYRADLWSTLQRISNDLQVHLTPVKSGFVDSGADFGSAKVRPVKARRVAMLTGQDVSPEASGEVWHYFDHDLNYPITMINSRDFMDARMNDFDVLILPSGRYSWMEEKPGADALKNWVQSGGTLIAMENAVAQLSKTDWSIKMKKNDASDADPAPYEALKKYENREREFVPTSLPGSIFTVELDRSNPLAFGYPEKYYTLKMDTNIYQFIENDGWNVGVLKKDRQVAGFVGSKLGKYLQDGLLFGIQPMGRGQIVYLADDVLFRNFWENGKLMMANAIFLAGQ